ncbi:PKD domain-containing protein [Chryseobacterium sp.]|uniref:PKD domain-containing protein n=1 Tax=Chryseobacterium sp. TaxID=1871047 RepID=UPI0028A00521|nr:PKD domain-containing protein [Chryseobacterium sp.]
MKNNTYFSRQHIFRWLLLCWLLVPWALQAQSARITWNSQVGCQEYRGEKGGNDDNGTTFSFINSSQCLRVCEGSTVTYIVSGQNISYVQWNISGGNSTVSGTGNTQAVVNWGAAGSGAVQATITYTDGTVENQNICIEKINSPVAKFEMKNLKSTVCRNTTIYFENLSYQNGGTEIINYFWDFGDGTTSTAFEPSHAYANPGNYTVRLTVTNKCGCSSSVKMPVEVLKSTPVQINCASVVCEGSVEKYNVQDGCPGKWKVIGGTIVNNNGSEIEVVWDNVDPADGFGYVMYQSECGCPEWTTIKIPVILKKGKIKGEPIVCTGKQYIYGLPQWPTTSVKWNVSGPGTAILDYNQQRNEVLFTANQPGTYTLTADYFNTLLSCSGQTYINIVVEAPVLISGGADEICVGTSQSFNANPNVPVTWKVVTGNSVYTSPPTTGTFSYNFATAGSYTVTATKVGGACESNPIQVKVLPNPQPPTGPIVGEEKVCPGKPYIFKLNSVDPGVVPVWEVTNGTIQGSNSGASVTIVFNASASQYVISVRNKLTSSPVGCLSTPISRTVVPLDLNTITINPNPGPFCPSSTKTFSANLNGITPDSMEWSFGSSNFGSIVAGQGTANITVNFNEITTTSTSTLKLKITKCGTVKTIEIPIALQPLPVVKFMNVGKICLGSPLTFTVDQGTITSASSVTFTFANGTTHSAVFNISGSYTFPNNSYIQNNTGGNISQTVIVTYAGTNGCNYTPTGSASFIVLPETIITISPVYNIVVCDPATMNPHTLTANSSTGLTGISSWQWYRNGVQIPGATSNSYTISGPNAIGTYMVQATDINTCVVYSQEVRVRQSCSTGSGCTGTDPQISFTPKWVECNKITVTNLSYIGTADEIIWESDPILTLDSGQGTSLPVYKTTMPAAHIVFVRIRFGSCWYTKAVEVQKKYEAKFNESLVCNGSNGYTLKLHNTSTIFNITSAISYTFSGGGQPDQYGQTATYTNLAPGTYTFTMTMVAAGFPSCSMTKTITIPPVPSLSFTSPSKVCVGEVINLTPVGYNPANTYTWLFSNTSIIASGPTTAIAINTSGPTNIKLRIKTPQGCVFESANAPINVVAANLNGSINPLSVVACVGSSPAITFVPSGAAPSGYIWMNGSQQVAGAPNSATFIPTQSGNYWPILISADNCRTEVMSSKLVPVTLKNLPYVNISGKANICAGSSTTLNGIVTDNTLEYQWKKGGSVVIPWSSAAAPIVYNTGALAAGTYVYTLEVRTPGTSGCMSTKNFTVTVSSPPPAVSITYTLQSCQPYRVKLTASGGAGDYNWSNGMVGQSITVNEGGAYQVTYTAPSGCKVVGNTQVPLSLESLMWVFPTGCYDECYRKSYVIGPKGIFDHHEWQYFGSNVQGGNNAFINPYYLGSAGTYNLQIDHFGCQYTSGPLNYFPGKECGVSTECRMEGDLYMKWDGDHFNVYGVIYNSSGQAVTLTISSGNGVGSYLPSMITIPAGGSYDMNANPLTFYPNVNYSGWDEILFINGECKFAVKVDGQAGKATERTLKVTSDSSLKMIPNPAKERVKISYNTGSEKLQAKQVTVFDAMGNVKFRKELKASSGEVDVEISGWLQGVYIVIVQTGDTSMQGKLIKN